MPKIIDYPFASFKSSCELAQELDSLGGNASLEIVAEKSGRKMSGGFRALVSSAVKFGLVSVSKGRLTTTELFRELKLSYTHEDEVKVLRRAFLGVPVFNRVYEQFKGKALPLDIFEKVLMREYSVGEPEAGRVAGYFIEGAKMCELYLDEKLVDAGEVQETNEQTASALPPSPSQISAPIQIKTPVNAAALTPANFSVRISGPGMDSEIQINEPDDLDIVHIMLRKIAKQLSAKTTEPKNEKPSNGDPSDG